LIEDSVKREGWDEQEAFVDVITVFLEIGKDSLEHVGGIEK